MVTSIEDMRDELFILGAGFSKAISDNMPLMADLSEESRSIGGVWNTAHPEIKAIFRIENNVETWLSCLLEPAPFVRPSVRWSQRAVAFDIVDALRQKIELGEAGTLTNDPPDWLMELAGYWVHHGSSIATFNYDTLAERAITEYIRRTTLPCTTAHLFPFFTDATRPGYPGGYPERQCANCVLPQDPPNYYASLHKLHGSINWYYSGSDSYSGETLYQVPVMGWSGGVHVHGSLTRQHDYDPVAGKQPLIIPPVMNKSPRFQHEAITALWNDAHFSLLRARRIFAIGYSLPSADTGFQHLLHQNAVIRELTAASDVEEVRDDATSRPKTIYVVNVDSSVVDWYEERLGHSYDIDGTYTGQSAIERLVRDLPNLSNV